MGVHSQGIVSIRAFYLRGIGSKEVYRLIANTRELVTSVNLGCVTHARVIRVCDCNSCEPFLGFIELNGNRGTHSDCKSSSNNDNDDEETRGGCGKAKLGAIRAIIATSKFRNSLKRRRCAGLNRLRNLPIVDVRDAKDQQAVEELRRELIARNLLLEQHDDYHVLLRSVPNSVLDIRLSLVLQCKSCSSSSYSERNTRVMRTHFCRNRP